MLQLQSFDHERLTDRYAGPDSRLIDVLGQAVNDLFAWRSDATTPVLPGW